MVVKLLFVGLVVALVYNGVLPLLAGYLGRWNRV